jgi:hypothetical protein
MHKLMMISKPQRPHDRQSERRPGNFGAYIVLSNGHKIPCVVKDFSGSGALLLVNSVLGIPGDFVLQAINGAHRNVQVVRQGSGKIAVRFV